MVEAVPHLVQPMMAEIRQAICDEFGISEIDLLSQRRPEYLARPRQIGMYLAHRLTTRSLPDIGRHFRRDHTTVLYANRKVAELASEDAELSSRIGRVSDRVTAIVAQRRVAA